MKRWILLTLFCPCIAFGGPDLAEHFTNTHVSLYFVFHYNDDVASSIPELVEFSDSFIDVVTREFFPAKFTYPIHVCVLKDRGAFKRFLRDVAQVAVSAGDWGVYLWKHQEFCDL